MRLTAAILIIGVLLGACGSSSGAPDGPLEVGRAIYGRSCSACHGPSGGGGVGPALSGVLTTFPSCEDHQHWVRLGSHRWKEEVGPTYGATDKQVSGAMPSFESSLTAEEIASVATFERVRYGGGDLETVSADCGVSAPSTTTGS